MASNIHQEALSTRYCDLRSKEPPQGLHYFLSHGSTDSSQDRKKWEREGVEGKKVANVVLPSLLDLMETTKHVLAAWMCSYFSPSETNINHHLTTNLKKIHRAGGNIFLSKLKKCYCLIFNSLFT